MVISRFLIATKPLSFCGGDWKNCVPKSINKSILMAEGIFQGQGVFLFGRLRCKYKYMYMQKS